MIASVVWAMWWAWMVLLSVVALTIVLLWVFPYYREKRFLTRWRVTAAAMLDHEMQPSPRQRDPLHRCAWKPTLSRRVYPLPPLIVTAVDWA